MSPKPALPVDVAERVLRLLDEGRFTATYKQAVLVALLDLCLESTERDGTPCDSLTTRQVAEKVVALYWAHTRVWVDEGHEREGRILVQNGSGSRASLDSGGGIVAKIRKFRVESQGVTPSAMSLAQARCARPDEFRRLLDDVEWTLIAMPLPKLQRIGERNLEWLYRIEWRDVDEQDPSHREKPIPRKAQITAYQRMFARVDGGGLGPPSDFDNRIHLKPGVASAFARLHALLRPHILRHWAAQVVRLNGLDDDDVSKFLFEAEREDTAAVRRPLVELQQGRCFYCESHLTSEVHVDHFIPWARHPDNGLHNLVAADARCNGAKRDYLATVQHLERWRARSTSERESLERIATDARWDAGEHRALGVARAIYLALPEEMPLWVEGKVFEPSDVGRIRGALTG